MADLTLPDGFVIRPLRREDIEAVVAIETEAFSTPWRPETFAGLVGREAVELLVMADAEEHVIGYAVLWCILDQGELANLALATHRRGRGLGAILLHHVMQTARERGVERLFLEVRASNQRAIDLYHGFGFTDVGLRRGYYERPPEDARVMRAIL
jgi:[ribosomal protein S18]-alanine N-acetyltransferase